MKSAPNTSAATPPPAISSAEPQSVLLAVTGMSPAIITETIWALAHPAPGEPPVLPHRVIVLTTTAGRREIEAQLFAPAARFGGRTPWDTLRASLQAAGHDLEGRLRFGATPDDLRVFTTQAPATGLTVELEDIRTPEDNEAAASFILDHLRGLVEDPDKTVIASLAGGRKTMGALLYACMSLIGREGDRLTHVLVTPPYELLREFFYPAQPGGPLAGRDGATHAPGQAAIQLADVPFVPLRYLFHRELGRPAGGFRRLIESCRGRVRERVGEGIRLTVDLSRRWVEVNGATLEPAAREHLVLCFLATRCKQGAPALRSYKEALEPLEAYRRDILHQSASQASLFGWWSGLEQPFDEQDDQELRRLLSSLRRKLLAAGAQAALLHDCLPEKGRFSLQIPPSLIFLKP